MITEPDADEHRMEIKAGKGEEASSQRQQWR